MKLVLLRHGVTQANLEHRYCGSTDLPLCPQGAAELTPLSLPLDNPRYFTSGMRRTNETLQLLLGDVPFTVLPDFREIDFGIFEMHTYEELKDAPEYQAWISGDNESNVPPRGESGNAMTRRVLDAYAELCKLPGDKVLVTHGGVIAAIMASLFPGENKSRYVWQPAPGHGYMLENGSYTPIP